MSGAAIAAIKEALVACGRSRPDNNFYDAIAKVLVHNQFVELADLAGADVKHISQPEGTVLSGAQWAFIMQQIDRMHVGRAPPLTPAISMVGPSSVAAGISADDFAAAVDRRRKPIVAHIDMQTKLAAVSLSATTVATLPKSREVDELGADVKRLTESGVAKPFPYCELKKFLPPWMTGVLGATKTMPFGLWVAAYQRWSLAAVCNGLADIASCNAHLDNCLRAGVESSAAGRSASLNVVYDEVVRKKLADLAHAGLAGFEINAALSLYDRDAIALAEIIFAAGRPSHVPKSWQQNQQQWPRGQQHWEQQGQQHEPFRHGGRRVDTSRLSTSDRAHTPPRYPPRNKSGDGAWAGASKRAKRW